jgi:hypothetical protein
MLHEPVDGAVELEDVFGPRVADGGFEEGFGEVHGAYGDAVFGLPHAEVLQAVVDEQRDVRRAIAEAGEADAERGERACEFGGEEPGGDVGFEATTDEGDDACAFRSLRTQEFEEAGLCGAGEALGFREVDKAFAGVFGGVRGEALFGFGSAELNEGTVMRGAKLMERAGDRVVSATGFTGESETAEVRGNAADLGAELRAGDAVAEKGGGCRIELAGCGSGAGWKESRGELFWSHTLVLSAWRARG